MFYMMVELTDWESKILSLFLCSRGSTKQSLPDFFQSMFPSCPACCVCPLRSFMMRRSFQELLHKRLLCKRRSFLFFSPQGHRGWYDDRTRWMLPVHLAIISPFFTPPLLVPCAWFLEELPLNTCMIQGNYFAYTCLSRMSRILLPWKRLRILEMYISARHSKLFPALLHKNICFHMQGVTAKFAVDCPDILSWVAD